MMTALALGMIAAVLALAARVVTGSGRRLIVALVILAFGVGSINSLIEAVVFDVMPLAEVPPAIVRQLVLALVMSFAVIVILGKWGENNLYSSVPQFRPVRLAAAALGYLVLYLAAGALVFPFVKDFYATKALPTLSILIPLQLFRGFLYVLYAWPWLRLGPRHVGWVLGLVYAVLGGVAPLLVDGNPYLPREVRMPHLVEVGVSNFVFGILVGWLVGRHRRPDRVIQPPLSAASAKLS
jgi:hypothetical protein